MLYVIEAGWQYEGFEVLGYVYSESEAHRVIVELYAGEDADDYDYYDYEQVNEYE